MSQAIRVDSRFVTAHDTARILGVSKSRTEALIKIARRYTDRILRDPASRNGQSVDKVHAKKKSATTVVTNSSGRDASTKTSATKSKRAKARR
jgi:hypothetical protein